LPGDDLAKPNGREMLVVFQRGSRIGVAEHLGDISDVASSDDFPDSEGMPEVVRATLKFQLLADIPPLRKDKC